MDIDKDYKNILQTMLEKRLNRLALPYEIVNADNDADLVNETFWQLLVKLSARVDILESKIK